MTDGPVRRLPLTTIPRYGNAQLGRISLWHSPDPCVRGRTRRAYVEAMGVWRRATSGDWQAHVIEGVLRNEERPVPGCRARAGARSAN
jgi:hypothetical protein